MNPAPGPSYGAGATTTHSSLSCLCGKTFSQQNAFTNHTRSCKSSKKRLASALDLAKDVWQRRKKKKQERLPEAEATVTEVDVGNLPMVIDEPEAPPVSLIRRVSLMLNDLTNIL